VNETVERTTGTDGKRYPTDAAANRVAIRQAIEANPTATNAEIMASVGTSRDTVIIVRADMEATRAMLEGRAPYQVMSPLTADEFAALKADIAARGVMVAVEYDDKGNVLDGHHRIRAVEELRREDPAKHAGLSWPRVVRKGLSEVQKRTHARVANTARRHLTTEQRRALILAQLADTPNVSDRQVAAMLGVSPSTVSATRATLAPPVDVSGNQKSTPQRAEGADGKSYPRDRDALRRAVRETIEADPTATNTAIAAELGTTRNTVIDERRAMEADAAEPEVVAPSKPPTESALRVAAAIRTIAESNVDPFDLEGIADAKDFIERAIDRLSEMLAAWDVE
jgi:ParB-like chromosome segregation protein Spo0J